MFRKIAVSRPAGTRNLQAVKVERAVQTDVDQAGNAAFKIGSCGRFVNVDPRQKFGGYVLQGHVPTGRGEDFAATDDRCHVGQTANQELIGFGGIAAYLNTGDMLQGFNHVVVGQLADVFGHDRVDDLGRFHLEVLRRLHARANARYHDGFHRLIGLGVRRHPKRAEQQGKYRNGRFFVFQHSFPLLLIFWFRLRDHNDPFRRSTDG